MKITTIIPLTFGTLIAIVAWVYDIKFIPLVTILLLTSTSFALSDYLRGD